MIRRTQDANLHNDWDDDFKVLAQRMGQTPHSHELAPADGLARGAVLLGIGVMLLTKVVEGAVPFYIHPRYTPLIAVTAVVLIGLALGHLLPVWRALTPQTQRLTRSLGLGLAPILVVAFWVHSPLVWGVALALLAVPLLRFAQTQGLVGRFGWSGFWLVLPIAVGLLVASQPLGTAALETKNILNQAPKTTSRWQTRDPNDTTQWTLVDWASALWQQPDPTQLGGKAVDVIGFVYRPKDNTPDTAHVARFVVACCTADSSGVSLPFKGEGIAAFEADTWVRVVGVLRWADLGKGREPFIEASSVTVVPRPATPYLYP